MVVQRHSFWLSSSLSQRVSFIALACALLATFSLWPAVASPWFYSIKYCLFFVVTGLLLHEYRKLRQWQLAFSLDEYGRGLLAGGDSFTLGARSFVSPWLVICFFESTHQSAQSTPRFLFVDMFSDEDYRSLCRLIINRRLPPTVNT